MSDRLQESRAEQRIKLWARRGHGFIACTYLPGEDPSGLIDRLDEHFKGSDIKFGRIDLLDILAVAPDNPGNVAGRMAVMLQEFGPGMVAITGFEKLLPLDANLGAGIWPFNGNRENFDVDGQHSLWVMPDYLRNALGICALDLWSWFQKRCSVSDDLERS